MPLKYHVLKDQANYGMVHTVNQVTNSKRAIILVGGDLIAYLFSLILTLTVRYGELPTRSLLDDHIPAFSILFVLFVVVNFSAGLYDKQSAFARGHIQGLLIKAQIVSIFIGITFFYIAPVLIAPKANLAIFFVISTILLFLWRTIMFPVFFAGKAQVAIMIGEGEDIEDLYDEVNANVRYGITFSGRAIHPTENSGTLEQRIITAVKDAKASIIVADLRNRAIESIMSLLYSQVFSGKQIIDASRLYEAIFDRIPLSMVGDRWLVENAGVLSNRRMYDILKRIMDIVVASVTGVIPLLLMPFVYAAIKLDDRGVLFVNQKRIGQHKKPITITKFRSMTADDAGKYDSNGKTMFKVTRVGKFTRLTRIDELPQLWSVIKGEQSLIGPRAELPPLVSIYEKEIPYYNIRHLIKPGLSGWAQIYHRAHPHHAVAVDDTRDKLSYDLYYIKNRSLTLDIRIALQTAKALLSRQGV